MRERIPTAYEGLGKAGLRIKSKGAYGFLLITQVGSYAWVTHCLTISKWDNAELYAWAYAWETDVRSLSFESSRMCLFGTGKSRSGDQREPGKMWKIAIVLSAILNFFIRIPRRACVLPGATSLQPLPLGSCTAKSNVVFRAMRIFLADMMRESIISWRQISNTKLDGTLYRTVRGVGLREYTRGSSLSGSKSNRYTIPLSGGQTTTAPVQCRGIQPRNTITLIFYAPCHTGVQFRTMSDAEQDDPLFQGCTQCGCEHFRIWGKWGIWYAVCDSCGNEYGLFPKCNFQLLREPCMEPEGRDLPRSLYPPDKDDENGS